MGRWHRDELDTADEVAVLRAVQGDRLPLRHGERFLAVTELRRRGFTYKQIATHLCIDDHQVYRYLHRAGMVATTVEATS